MFVEWVDGLPLYSFGHDGLVLALNCGWHDLDLPFATHDIHDIRPYFMSHGVETGQYMSSSIHHAFSLPNDESIRRHQALDDCRNIARTVLHVENQATQ